MEISGSVHCLPRSGLVQCFLSPEGSRGGVDRRFTLFPGGRRIAFFVGQKAAELWALENSLPPTRAAARP